MKLGEITFLLCTLYLWDYHGNMIVHVDPLIARLLLCTPTIEQREVFMNKVIMNKIRRIAK